MRACLDLTFPTVAPLYEYSPVSRNAGYDNVRMAVCGRLLFSVILPLLAASRATYLYSLSVWMATRKPIPTDIILLFQ